MHCPLFIPTTAVPHISTKFSGGSSSPSRNLGSICRWTCGVHNLVDNFPGFLLRSTSAIDSCVARVQNAHEFFTHSAAGSRDEVYLSREIFWDIILGEGRFGGEEAGIDCLETRRGRLGFGDGHIFRIRLLKPVDALK